MAVESHRCYFGSLHSDDRIAVCTALANGYADANAAFFRANLWAPRLDKLRPRYVAPPAAGGDPTCQGIVLAPALIKLRRGSCLDFAAYHAGWIQARLSLPASVEIEVVADGEPLHAIVRTSDGERFDVTRWIVDGLS